MISNRFQPRLTQLYGEGFNFNGWWSTETEALGGEAPINAPVAEVERYVAEIEAAIVSKKGAR